MTWRTEANTAWKQAQAVLIDVQSLIHKSMESTTPADYEHLINRALGVLIKAHVLDNSIAIEDNYNKSNKIEWFRLLTSQLELLKISGYPKDKIKDLLGTPYVHTNYMNALRLSFIGFMSQKHALEHFEAIAKHAYHDRMFAEMKREVELTAGSPLKREASKVNEDDHTYNLYP